MEFSWKVEKGITDHGLETVTIDQFDQEFGRRSAQLRSSIEVGFEPLAIETLVSFKQVTSDADL